jgi:hypothetical protein
MGLFGGIAGQERLAGVRRDAASQNAPAAMACESLGGSQRVDRVGLARRRRQSGRAGVSLRHGFVRLSRESKPRLCAEAGIHGRTNAVKDVGGLPIRQIAQVRRGRQVCLSVSRAREIGLGGVDNPATAARDAVAARRKVHDRLANPRITRRCRNFSRIAAKPVGRRAICSQKVRRMLAMRRKFAD